MYDNGSVLILDPKTQNSFKVNGHRLKPYIGEERPPPPHREELQSLELRLAKDVKLSTCWEATHLNFIFAFVLYFYHCFSIYFYFYICCLL